jgi:hypothetical protein
MAAFRRLTYRAAKRLRCRFERPKFKAPGSDGGYLLSIRISVWPNTSRSALLAVPANPTLSRRSNGTVKSMTRAFSVAPTPSTELTASAAPTASSPKRPQVASSRGLNASCNNIRDIASAAAHERVSRSNHSGEVNIISLYEPFVCPLALLPTPWVSSQLDCSSEQCARLRVHARTPQAFPWMLSRARL